MITDLLLPMSVLALLAFGGMLLLGLGLPGTWLVAVGVWAMGAWPGTGMGFEPWAPVILGQLLLVALLGEGLEFGVIWVGGRKLKLSRPAMVSAIVGGLVGAFMGSPAGPIGAVMGSWLGLVVFTIFWLVAFEAETFLDGLKGGLRALAARLIGLAVKSAVLMGMIAWGGYRLIMFLNAKPLG